MKATVVVLLGAATLAIAASASLWLGPTPDFLHLLVHAGSPQY